MKFNLMLTCQYELNSTDYILEDRRSHVQILCLRKNTPLFFINHHVSTMTICTAIYFFSHFVVREYEKAVVRFDLKQNVRFHSFVGRVKSHKGIRRGSSVQKNSYILLDSTQHQHLFLNPFIKYSKELLKNEIFIKFFFVTKRWTQQNFLNPISVSLARSKEK